MGQFERDGRDRGPRNVLLVQLAQDLAMHLGRMAKAFGIGGEYPRLLHASPRPRVWARARARQLTVGRI